VRTLIVFGIVGLLAQLVDGSLGMAYGVTTSTLLLAAGFAPAAASASVHLAELGTTLVSGISHHRFGNVNWAVVRRIGIPGAIGAFAGATVLSAISTEAARPWMAVVLLLLGLYVLARFALGVRPNVTIHTPRRRLLAPLGLAAGFVDATGGGGWGPLATPTLMTVGRMDPRTAIGSVSASEFLVTLAASLGFLFGLGTSGIDFGAVAALLVGGVLAAPLAAWLVRRLPLPVLGAFTGGLLVITNLRTLLTTFAVPSGAAAGAYLVVLVVWAVGIAVAVRTARRVAVNAQPEAQQAAVGA
jgi:uncharacterized membrane protein YfcA